MYYEDDNGGLSFVAGLAIGAIVGASVALLAAPQSGKRTRRRIVRAVADAQRNASDEWGAVADQVQRTVRQSRRRVRH